MTIKGLFQNEKIPQDFMEVHFIGSYWEKARQFIIENWDKHLVDLTDKQQKWAENILEDCLEYKLEKL